MNFKQWLINNETLDLIEDDFRADVLCDPDFPDNHERGAMHLVLRGACEEAKRVHRILLKRYLAEVNP